MCAPKLFHLIVIVICFNMSYCQRRIVKHNYTSIDKPYMVYLIQSNESVPKFDAWLCGGSLVRTNKILTSAACLIQTTNIYVIAGYKKYVSLYDLNDDNCTRFTKRRVVKICVPQGYIFDPLNATTWMTLDVGVAVVDRPYNSSDVLFRLYCHYPPRPIPILYHKELTYNNLDVIALGWGFRRGRRPGDPTDYNAEMLRYASTRLHDAKICKDAYAGLSHVIDKYMLCTFRSGDSDDRGTILITHSEFVQCWSRRGHSSDICLTNDGEVKPAYNDTRKQYIMTHKGTWGICQNDHGGPLVAFVGSREMVIGIATTTIYNTEYECVGPSLFTSTACTGNFIMCMITDNPVTRRAFGYLVKEEGLEIIRKDIVWADDPSDPSTPSADEDLRSEETTTQFNSVTEGIGNKTNLTSQI